MVLTIYGKKLNVERNVQYLISFMSINPKETIELFKACGGFKVYMHQAKMKKHGFIKNKVV